MNLLAGTKEFLEATDRSVRPDRMADRECALRFLAFTVTAWEEYKVNDLDGFLSEAMRKLEINYLKMIGTIWPSDFVEQWVLRGTFLDMMHLGNAIPQSMPEILLARRYLSLGALRSIDAAIQSVSV